MKPETKKCPSCDKTISIKAKKCPYCREDLRGFFRRHPILTILLILITSPFWITIIGAFIIGFSKGLSGSYASPSPQVNPTVAEQERNKLEQVQKQQLQELSTLFCSKRSKPSIRAVNLDDYFLMFEKAGEAVTLRPANGVYPTTENCQKVMDFCLTRWGDEDCQKIAERKVWIGMSKDQLILSWGLPNDRNNSTFSSRVKSQWVYGDFGPYVYLEGESNDSMTVTSWQDNQ